MKIRHPFAIKWIGLLGALLIRLLMSTLRTRYVRLGPVVQPRDLQGGEHFIYAFWHENLMQPCYTYATRRIKALISQHADGEMIALAAYHLGYSVIRGSTTRGGTVALRQMIRESRTHHLALIPDGPRGPRRQLQAGVIYLASATGLPIVVVGIGYEKPWRLKTWDHFAVPKPWSKSIIVSLHPIVVPPSIGREQIESYRKVVEENLAYATELADKLANK